MAEMSVGGGSAVVVTTTLEVLVVSKRRADIERHRSGVSGVVL